jgi:hypothetical protein
VVVSTRDLGPRARVPETDGLVLASGRDERRRGVPVDRLGLLAVTQQAALDTALLEVHHGQRLVVRGRDELEV